MPVNKQEENVRNFSSVCINQPTATVDTLEDFVQNNE